MFFRERIRRYANLKRTKGPVLKEGDKVYLNRRNIRLDSLIKKLDAVKLGLFKVKQQKGLINFKLELLRTIRIHPVFYISLLEKANPNATL